MINWEGVKALLCLAGAIIFTKEFYLFTHFVIKMYESGKAIRTTSRTKTKIIPNSTFFAIWCLGLYTMVEFWFPWVKIIIKVVYDY